jgi:RNA polymerase sigma factor (sigma-70 family)
MRSEFVPSYRLLLLLRSRLHCEAETELNMGARFPLAESTDPLLRPYLAAEDAEEAQRLLGQLIAEHVQPLVRDVARSRIRTLASFDGLATEDICSEAMLQLLGRMRDLRDDPEQAPISNFKGYVAAIVHNSCNHYIREKLPEHSRVKNQLRYVLNHHDNFATWEESGGDRFSGFAEWKSVRARWTKPSEAAIESIRRKAFGRADLRKMQPAALLELLFLLSNQPIEMEQLVGLVAEVWGVQDSRRMESAGEDAGEVWESIPDARSDTAAVVERRMYLAALWEEVRELRPMQRAALLLNLRERSGQDMLPMLVLVGVASVREIAESLGMPLQALEEIWDDLPLDDLAIAGRLGVTRQQVINLRKSARERLVRRMTGY